MARVILVDASVLIAWLDERDAHHEAAIDMLASVERFLVHPLTLAEVLVHPARQGREGEVLTRLQAIGMVVSTLPIDPVDLAKVRAATGLRMPDCVVLASARVHQLSVASFDEGLRAPT